MSSEQMLDKTVCEKIWSDLKQQVARAQQDHRVQAFDFLYIWLARHPNGDVCLVLFHGLGATELHLEDYITELGGVPTLVVATNISFALPTPEMRESLQIKLALKGLRIVLCNPTLFELQAFGFQA